MDDIPPTMREQNRLRPTARAAQAYGREHPDDFGGVYWVNDPTVRVVFLATVNLDGHLRALRSRVPHPERVAVQRCRYTERQLRAWSKEVGRRLRGREDQLNVTLWGREPIDEGFGIRVGIWPWSREAAERVRRELMPIPVEISEQGPLVPLGAPGTQSAI